MWLGYWEIKLVLYFKLTKNNNIIYCQEHELRKWSLIWQASPNVLFNLKQLVVFFYYYIIYK